MNPKFVKTFTVVYKFEEIQPLKFLLYDIDNSSDTLADDDFLGSCDVKLSEIVSGPGGSVTRPLIDSHGKASGSITIRSEQRNQARDMIVNMQFDGSGLAK